jgi:uncharacterized protein YlxW (UPF0749 family)
VAIIDSMRRIGRGWRFAAPIVLAFCGMLLVTSARAAGGDDLRGSDTLELPDLVRAEEQRVEELEAKITKLTSEIQQLTASRGDDKTADMNRKAEQLMPSAGLTPVAGPALTVTLDDAPTPPNADDEYNVEDFIVHQQDLEAVVNALWVGGAEGMTVMDQRVVSTSTIRCVGSVLLMHGRTYYPPYTITAIGDAETMRAALKASPEVQDYRDWADRVGLTYRVADEGTVTMPAYTGTIRGGQLS